MIGQIEGLLQKGIEAARADDLERAREYFIRVIELDQYNEKAWLWLSSVAEREVDKLVCLENVLAINPDNTYASAQLQHLSRKLADSDEESLLPRLAYERPVAKKKRAESPPPARRICPRCGYSNPGWAYLCDKCGANLRAVDLRTSVGPVARERKPLFATLFESWGGVITFDRLFAYLPEVEIASWGRTLTAFFVAILFAVLWQAIVTLSYRLLIGQRVSWGAVRLTILPALTTTAATFAVWSLPYLLIAPLTWGLGRLLGGRGSFKVHAHLVAIAVTGWLVLGGLLRPFPDVLLAGLIRDWQLRATIQTVLPIVAWAGGALTIFAYLVQAVETAQRFSAVRAFLTVVMSLAATVPLAYFAVGR